MTRRLALNLALLALFLVVCTGSLCAALRFPPILNVDIGAQNDLHFIANFFEIERGEGAVFRWSGPGAQLRLHGAEAVPDVLQLRVHSDARAVQSGQGIQLTRNEQPVGAFKLQAGWRVYHILLRDEVVGATPALGLETSVLMPPVKGRELGVALDAVRVVPLQPGLIAPLVRALLLAWWLVLLALVLWFILSIELIAQRIPSRWQSVGKPLLVGAVIVVAALLLVGAAQRDPYNLTRAIPPLPWVEALATLAVIIVGVRSQEPGARSQELAAKASSVLGSRFLVLGSFSLLIIAQVLLTTQTAVALGVGVAVLALVLLVYGGDLGSSVDTARADVAPRSAALLLALIFVVALAMRFYQLGALPYGLWRDEAEHGLAALRMLEDTQYRPIYIAENQVNMPALGLYPFAIAIKLWGIHPWTMRVVTAFAGALTVFPLYALVRQLWERRDLALLAAALLAVATWHIIISRFSFPAIFDPLFALTGLWLLTLGLDHRPPITEHSGFARSFSARLLPCASAGVCFAVALQTYHTGRVVPLVGAVLALLLLGRNVRQWRRWLLGVVAALLGFALVSAPLANYVLRHPASFNARTSYVFLLGEEALHGQAPLVALKDSIDRHVLMFNVHGDDNGRHANPGKPMLDFMTGLGLLLGCAVLARRWRDWRSMFVFAALAISLLPSLLSVESPHGMRSIGGAAFACIIAAVGWAELGTLIARQFSQRGTQSSASARGARVYHGACVVVALAALMFNYRIYFVQMPSNPEVWQSYYPAHTQAGAYIRNLAMTQGKDTMPQIFVRNSLATNAVFRYLTHGLHVQEISDKMSARTVHSGALFVLSGYSYANDVKRLTPYVSASAQPVARGPLFPDGKTPSFVVYRRDH